jgi:hypothetical protein
MSDEELDGEILRRVGIGRREFVRKLLLGTAFAVPAIASFDMATLTAASAQPAMTGNGTVRPTQLVATPAIVSVGPPTVLELFNLTATLTVASTGQPVADKKIVFSAGGHRLGVAYTNADGVATLNVEHNAADRIYVIEAQGYQAHFAGTAHLGPSTASAGLVQL